MLINNNNYQRGQLLSNKHCSIIIIIRGENLMKIFKKGLVSKIIIIIIIVVLSTSLILLTKLFFPKFGDPVYGNRLDGIEEVTLDVNRLADIKNTIINQKEVNNAILNIKGTLINIIIDVKVDIDVVTAKTVGTKAVTLFSSAEQNFYDIQVFITQSIETEETQYPLIGYKNKLSPSLVWNNIK